MNTDVNEEAEARPEGDVLGAIAGFEEVLERMPDDCTALEALARAYERLGDHTRARDHYVRLGDVLLRGGETSAAGELLKKLRTYADDDVKVLDLMARIERMAGAGGGGDDAAGEAAAPTGVGAGVSCEFNIASEMSFAWSMMEAGKLTQDEYARVVEDLTEMSGHQGGAASAVSVLHVLEAQGSSRMERVMIHAARERNTPIILLDNFDVNVDAMKLITREFMVGRGAMAFELLSSDVLVAVLNPYDATLFDDVRTLTGKTCHFYITVPSQFDRHMARYESTLAPRKATTEE